MPDRRKVTLGIWKKLPHKVWRVILNLQKDKIWAAQKSQPSTVILPESEAPTSRGEAWFCQRASPGIF